LANEASLPVAHIDEARGDALVVPAKVRPAFQLMDVELSFYSTRHVRGIEALFDAKASIIYAQYASIMLALFDACRRAPVGASAAHARDGPASCMSCLRDLAPAGESQCDSRLLASRRFCGINEPRLRPPPKGIDGSLKCHMSTVLSFVPALVSRYIDARMVRRIMANGGPVLCVLGAAMFFHEQRFNSRIAKTSIR
jgi:hypothetical protein